MESTLWARRLYDHVIPEPSVKAGWLPWLSTIRSTWRESVVDH